MNFDKASLAVPGANALEFAEDMAAQHTDYKITTIQMAGYAAADIDGEVTEEEIAPSSRWIPVKPYKGTAFSLTPDTTDNAVYIDEYVNYLVQKLGNATSRTGIQAYSLDNEPALWKSTHARMHPEQTTCREIVVVILANDICEVIPGGAVKEIGGAFLAVLALGAVIGEGEAAVRNALCGRCRLGVCGEVSHKEKLVKHSNLPFCWFGVCVFDSFIIHHIAVNVKYNFRDFFVFFKISCRTAILALTKRGDSAIIMDRDYFYS